MNAIFKGEREEENLMRACTYDDCERCRTVPPQDYELICNVLAMAADLARADLLRRDYLQNAKC